MHLWKGLVKNIMSDIFNRSSAELSERAIKGIIDDEITNYKKEEVALPIIKLKLPDKESTVKIKKPAIKLSALQEAVRPAAGTVTAPRPEITLPDSLTASQKLRKAFRYRRYGMTIRLVKPKEREMKPLPEVKPEDLKKLKIFQLKKYFLGTWLLIPALVIFILFSWMPILKTVFISFTRFLSFNKSTFIGIQNFTQIFSDAKFWQAFGHSVELAAVVILIGTWLPLFIALYVHEMRRNSSIIKILYFIPFLTPAVPAAILWKWLYSQSYGLINSFLSLITTLNVHIGWLTNPNLVIFSIAIVFLWKNIGWAMLIYIAGLQNMPKTLFEEASLHGASVWVKIKDIMLPSLSPVILAVVFVQIINSLQVFTEVYIMTDGGPVGSSEMVATYIYKKAFLYMDIGYACAMALVFLFILISITLARMNLTAKRG